MITFYDCATAPSPRRTRLLLAERAPGPAWRLGPDRDAPLYEGLGLSFESLDKAAFIARWRGVTASEVSTAQSFVIQLCDLLGVEPPGVGAQRARLRPHERQGDGEHRERQRDGHEELDEGHAAVITPNRRGGARL